jgi:cytochrome P450
MSNAVLADTGSAPMVGGALPVLGHVVPLWRDPLDFLEVVRATGPVAFVRLGPFPAYVVSDYAVAKRILVDQVDQFEKGVQFEKGFPLVGDGIVAVKGELHLQRRRMIQPSFHPSRIADYAEIMRRDAVERVRAWETGTELRLDTELRTLAIGVLARALFSTDLSDEDVHTVEAAFPIAMHGIGRRAVAPFKVLEMLPTAGNRRFNRAIAALHEVTDRIIAAKRARAEFDGKDLLSALLAAQHADPDDPTPDRRIHDEAITMLVAGSDTISSTLAWVCYQLARDPELQEAVHAEVRAAHPADAGLDHNALARLPLMRRVATEVLRLYPPGWMISRRAVADVSLDGVRIPKGSHVLISVYGIHRDPMIYPQPQTFRPDRWAEGAPPIPRAAFMPFGMGKRGCIGEPFAWLEIAVVLSTILRHWQISLAPGCVVQALPRLTMTISQLRVRLEGR